MSAAPQSGSSGNGAGASSGTFTVDVNLGATYSTDPTACLKQPADLPDDVLAILVGRLEETYLESFSVGIDAAAVLAGEPSVDNGISLRSERWLQLGKNKDRIGAGWPTVVYDGDPGEDR
ncbi:MAG TPA: hypothetical protein VMM79_13275 [Longimicrobiales bacterium]|nr:hypothetical protein [Longimicrobiales bacterium]